MRGMIVVCCSLLGALALSIPSGARAQQPLAEFLAAAQTRPLDVRAARAALEHSRGRAEQARGRLLPSISAQGTYARNEYPLIFEVMGTQLTIQQVDQVDASFSAGVAVLDLGGWASFFAAEAATTAAERRAEGSVLDAEELVVALWYQLVASRHVVEAARQTLETASQLLGSTEQRVSAGTAPAVEALRAEAEVRRSRQSVAEAELDVVLTERSLRDATFLEPTPELVELDDDLHPEPPLERFLRAVEEHPRVRAGRAEVSSAGRALGAAWLALAPRIDAIFTERVTNAPGFAMTTLWSLRLTATWRLDFVTPAIIGTQRAIEQETRIRLDQTRQQTESRIFDAWHRVRALRHRAEASTAEVALRERALVDVRSRAEVGLATQLDVIAAQRDVFASRVAHISAIASLRAARALLRIRSGVHREGIR